MDNNAKKIMFTNSSLSVITTYLFGLALLPTFSACHVDQEKKDKLKFYFHEKLKKVIF